VRREGKHKLEGKRIRKASALLAYRLIEHGLVSIGRPPLILVRVLLGTLLCRRQAGMYKVENALQEGIVWHSHSTTVLF
jgi:hypothetical protein